MQRSQGPTGEGTLLYCLFGHLPFTPRPTRNPVSVGGCPIPSPGERLGCNTEPTGLDSPNPRVSHALQRRSGFLSIDRKGGLPSAQSLDHAPEGLRDSVRTANHHGAHIHLGSDISGRTASPLV